MEEQPKKLDNYNDEITLKELILKIQEFWFELWSNKAWIIIVALVMGGIFALRSYLTPQTFQAELTFMVNEDEGNGFGGMGGLLGQFGFPSSGTSSEFNLDKILKLSQSRRIIYPAIMDTLLVDHSKSIIANHIIDVYDYHKKWAKSDNENIHKFKFTSNQFHEFTAIENIVLKSIYSKVVGNAKKSNDPLLDGKYNEDTGILELTIVSESASLSEYLVLAIYDNLSEYYVTKTIEPQTETVNALNEKTDSIKRALVNAEIKLARYDDANLSLFKEKDRVKRERLSREVGILTIMYGEAVKNLETASFTLSNKTPFFQIIDPPATPLTGSLKGYLKSIIFGLLLGGLLAFTYFILRKIFVDTMQ